MSLAGVPRDSSTKLTVEPATKPVPVIVTGVPPVIGPVAGETDDGRDRGRPDPAVGHHARPAVHLALRGLGGGRRADLAGRVVVEGDDRLEQGLRGARGRPHRGGHVEIVTVRVFALVGVHAVLHHAAIAGTPSMLASVDLAPASPSRARAGSR